MSDVECFAGLGARASRATQAGSPYIVLRCRSIVSRRAAGSRFTRLYLSNSSTAAAT
jgi:hypothetical protein